MFEGVQKIAKTVLNGLNKVTDQAIEYSTTDMEDLNINQMMNGLNSDGDTIGEYRSVSYAAMKQRMNSQPPPMVPDLRLTGAFHSGLTIDYTGSDLLFTSTDEKTDDITRKYGQNIFGLTEKNQQLAQNEYIFPIITDWLGKQLSAI